MLDLIEEGRKMLELLEEGRIKRWETETAGVKRAATCLDRLIITWKEN